VCVRVCVCLSVCLCVYLYVCVPEKSFEELGRTPHTAV
jgi:hypothetical protein